MTNSNGNTGKFDVLTEQIGRFTETVDPLAVTVAHLTLTVKHGFAALKVISREQSANSSQLIALAQDQPAAARQQQTFDRQWARAGGSDCRSTQLLQLFVWGAAGT